MKLTISEIKRVRNLGRQRKQKIQGLVGVASTKLLTFVAFAVPSVAAAEVPGEYEMLGSAELEYIEFLYERIADSARAKIDSDKRTVEEIDSLLYNAIAEDAACVVAAVRLQAHIQNIPLEEALPEIWCDCTPEEGVTFNRKAFRQARGVCNSRMNRQLQRKE